MPSPIHWILGIGLAATSSACDEGVPLGRSAPSTFPSQPRTLPVVPFYERAIVVEAGDVMRGQVGNADVPCDFGYYCKFYLLTVPRDGTLEVGMIHAPGALFSPPFAPIDMWIQNDVGHKFWMDGKGPDIEAFARVGTVRSGQQYQVGIVSYELPGVTYQLRFEVL